LALLISPFLIVLFACAVFDILFVNNLSFAEVSSAQKAENKKLEKELIKSGKKCYGSKEYDEAIKKWEEALTLDPNNKKIKKYIEEAKKKLERKLKKEKRLISVTSPPEEMLPILSLDDCIKIAETNSLPLQIARKSMKLADMRLFEARRNMLPSVSFNWEDVDGRVNAKRYLGRKQTIEGQQAIFHGGELYFTMKQAEVNLDIVKTDYKRIKNELILQVKKAYYTLAKSKENLKIQIALKEEVEKILDMVNKQFELAITSKLEYLNVSSQAGQVDFQIVSAAGDEDLAELILKQAMNVDFKDKITIEPKLEFTKLDVDFNKVLNAAFLNRPEMKINSMMLQYYKYEKDIAKAKGWPKIDVMGAWGMAKEEYAADDRVNYGVNYQDIDQKLEQQYYYGIKASMPFWGSTTEISRTNEQWVPMISTTHGTEAKTTSYKFNFLDNLKYYSDKQLADIELDRANQEFNKTKQDIILEVREGCYNYEKTVVQLETASNKVKYQEKDLEFVKVKRSMDEAQDSSIVESMVKLAQEKFGYVQALTDYYIAIASINKAVGEENYIDRQNTLSGISGKN